MIPDRQLSSQTLSVEGVCSVIPNVTVRLNTHLAVLEVVEEDVKTLGLNTVVLDDNARAADDLARVALTVDLAETSPGAKDLRVTDLDQVDLVLRTESFDQLDVLGLRARLNENAQMRLTLVERLRALAETASKTVMDEGVLQDLLRVDMLYK